jgi:hypothetical protein
MNNHQNGTKSKRSMILALTAVFLMTALTATVLTIQPTTSSAEGGGQVYPVTLTS